MKRLLLIPMILLPACANQQIKQAKEDGYAAGVREEKMIGLQQQDAIEDNARSLRFALSQCNERLMDCQNAGRDK